MSVVESLIEFFGLNYTPTTFADLITWLVLVYFLLAFVSSVVRLFLHFSFLVSKGGKR